jgi:LPPG:FO 2-phospho-L-lactate transferase
VKASRVVALCGGIGGAKLADGLYRVLPPDTLTVVVNTGDDFEHLDLRICPDIDTVIYTLAGLANPELGWGRRDETWTFMQVLAKLGGETWFRLGDGDLALHVGRTRRLAGGETLSHITADVTRRFDIAAQILPMSDDPVRTRIGTPAGEIAFQDYFVRQRCAPHVTSLRFEGTDTARAAPGVVTALQRETPSTVIICPSNPYLSIDPILAVRGVRELVRACGAPVIAVTPLVGGRALKGPTAKIMGELGVPLTPVAIAQHYRGLIDGFLLDRRDRAFATAFDLSFRVADTVMITHEDRDRVAREVLNFSRELGSAGRGGRSAG